MVGGHPRVEKHKSGNVEMAFKALVLLISVTNYSTLNQLSKRAK
jgi:hypothetical protein